MSAYYLIIGSNSFSGSNMIKHLVLKKRNIIAISRSKEKNACYLPYKKIQNYKKYVKFFQIDINNDKLNLKNLINKYKPSYVINYAGQGMVEQSWSNPEDWYLTNVIGQLKLINFLISVNSVKKYIHFTTPEVYGNTKKIIKENFNFSPSTPYANSRASFDFHLKMLNEKYDFPVIFTRAANVYGECQDLFRIIPKTIMKIKKNSKIELHGGGNSLRSFIHIDDVSIALMQIINKGKKGETYHISTNAYIKISKLVQIICKNLNVDYKNYIKNTSDRVGKDKAYLLNSSKLRKLGWRDKIDLENGILNTKKWIEENYIFLKKQKLNYSHKK